MKETDIKIKLLFDILIRKKRLLYQVLTITENQEMLLLSGEKSEEIAAFFNGMCTEKQNLIDEIMKADNLFDNTFSEISPQFEEYADKNKEIVRKLQDNIKEVMDFDVKIRVLEQRNKEFIERSKNQKPKTHAVSKNYMIKQYQKAQKESLK